MLCFSVSTSYFLRALFISRAVMGVLDTGIVLRILFFSFFHVLIFYIFDLYNLKRVGNRNQQFISVGISVLVASGLINAVLFFHPDYFIGRIVWLIHIPVTILVVFSWRAMLSSYFLKSSNASELLCIGYGSSMIDFVMELLKSPFEEFKRIYIFTENSSKPINHPKVTEIEGVEELEKIFQRMNLSTIVVGAENGLKERLFETIIHKKFRGTKVIDLSSAYKIFFGKIPAREMKREWLLALERGEMVFKPLIYLKIKRLMDICLSLLGIIVSLPITLIAGLAIKINSPGPLFFIQTRVGIFNKEFDLVKFRTMRHNAESETGPVWAAKNDPRITRVGRFLRKTRIDEIPQLINVLKGGSQFNRAATYSKSL